MFLWTIFYRNILYDTLKVVGDIKQEYAKNEILAEISCYLFMKRFDPNVEYNFNYRNVWSNRMADDFEFGEFESIYTKLIKYIDTLIF